MPSFTVYGYRFFFWSNEYKADDILEPIHIHVCKGEPEKDAPKWWIGHDGKIQYADNCNNLKSFGLEKSDINKIESIISANINRIIEMWQDHFVNETLAFYDDIK